MCTLYSISTNQEAIRRLSAVDRDLTGNMPPLPGIFPDYETPIVRSGPASRELVMARLGMPYPPQDQGTHVVNIRNTQSVEREDPARVEAA